MSSTTIFQYALSDRSFGAVDPTTLGGIRSGLLNWIWDEDGTTAVEYAVMVAMIAVACVTAVNLMSSAARDSFQSSAESIGQ